MVTPTQSELLFCAYHKWMGSHGYFLFHPATPNPLKRNIPAVPRADRTIFPHRPNFFANLDVYALFHAAKLLKLAQDYDYVLLCSVCRLAVRGPLHQSWHSRSFGHYCNWVGSQRAYMPSAVCLQPSRDEQSDRVGIRRTRPETEIPPQRFQLWDVRTSIQYGTCTRTNLWDPPLLTDRIQTVH